MTYEEHIEATKTFLLAEELLIRSGMDMAAAEAVWGAAIQVIDATAHQAGARYVGSNRDRAQIVEYLENKYGRYDLNAGFDSVKTYLHNHFYTGRLNNAELSRYLESGIDFVNRIIELSERERTGS